MRLSLLINPYVISFLDIDNVVLLISAKKFQVTEHSRFERNDFSDVSTNKGLGYDIEEGGEGVGRVPL